MSRALYSSSHMMTQKSQNHHILRTTTVLDGLFTHKNGRI
jgi:hypothetical protein